MENIKNTDIYLLDQILKGRFLKNFKILDAGCGLGRNMSYFIHHGFHISGIDMDKIKIETLQKKHQNINLTVANLDKIPYSINYFDYIICNAVLHFAKSEKQFFNMFSELFRILKPSGTIFIRMTSNFGIEKKVKKINDNIFKLPDGTTRFLLTENILNKLKSNFNFDFIEPLKTVNVNDLRCMSTLVLKKGTTKNIN